jgi:hypothetical protein
MVTRSMRMRWRTNCRSRGISFKYLIRTEMRATDRQRMAVLKTKRGTFIVTTKEETSGTKELAV